MVWGPLHGEHQEFHGICIQDEVATLKIDAQASAHIPTPNIVSLQYLEQREVGLK